MNPSVARRSPFLVIPAFVAALALPGDGRAQNAAFDAAIRDFDAKLTAEVARDAVGGITAGVVVGNDVVWAKGFGWADVARETPATASTVYRIGSITKSFTAVVLEALVDRGLVALDDPVMRFLPEIAGLDGEPAQARMITFRQLASHTAGLAREPSLKDAADGFIVEWESKVLSSIPATRIASAPGERYAYSNIGFGILGLALSRAAHRPYIDMVVDMVLGPLGMGRTGFALDPPLREKLATGYANGSGVVDTEAPAREHRGRGYKVPNGGLYSTVADLARYIAMFTGASRTTVLSAERRAEMMSVQTPGSRTEGYGLGLTVNGHGKGRRTVGHGGAVAGYTSFIAFDPDTRIGVILLRNYDVGATDLGAAGSSLLDALDAAGAGLPMPVPSSRRRSR